MRRKQHAVLAALMAIGCGDGASSVTDASDASYTPPPLPDATPVKADCNELDILFVIGNSVQSAQLQADLLTDVGTLFDAIGGLPQTPTLHVGVISADVGAIGQNVPGCEGVGDDGIMQQTPRTPGCNAQVGAFLRQVDAAQNFQGRLVDAFRCVAALGQAGCPFQQPLEATRRALDPTTVENTAFLRPGADLLVIFVSGEDDCSAKDATLFDPSQDSLGSELGFLTTFRCAEFGVTCDEGNLTRAAATYTSCEPRTDSFMRDPAYYATFLEGLKPDGEILVAVVGGATSPLRVETSPDGEPQIDQSCLGVEPSIRLVDFASHFPGADAFVDACQPSGNDIGADLAAFVRRACTP